MKNAVKLILNDLPAKRLTVTSTAKYLNQYLSSSCVLKKEGLSLWIMLSPVNCGPADAAQILLQLCSLSYDVVFFRGAFDFCQEEAVLITVQWTLCSLLTSWNIICCARSFTPSLFVCGLQRLGVIIWQTCDSDSDFFVRVKKTGLYKSSHAS